MIARSPYDFEWSNITFNHFHGFCNDILNELNVPKPHENYLENIVSTVENAISDTNIDQYKFDAILIDEGQDYEWGWYNLLSQFLRERNELFFVCDKKQNIYDRELSWIDNMGDFKGKVQFKGVWPELNTVYRIPKKIGDIANKFSEEFGLEQSIEVSEEYQQLTLFERPPLFEWEKY
jgi:superfamily I DNA/RNA helicase